MLSSNLITPIWVPCASFQHTKRPNNKIKGLKDLMGNCIKIRATATTTIHEEDDNMPQVRPKEETLEREEGVSNSNGVKVKVLLTRAELEWLMAELKNGEKKLEEVLAEMSKEREKENERFDGSWKPSLESIVESPEMLSFY